MKFRSLFIFLSLLLCFFAAISAEAARSTDYGNIPLSFEKNLGQADKHIQFLSRGQGYGFFLTGREAVLRLIQPRPAEVRMSFVGGTSGARIDALDPLPGKTNYMKGSNSAAWHKDVTNYARVRYSEVYPGIDVIYYGNQRQLEYDLVLAPGTRPEIVRVHFDGIRGLQINGVGELVLKTGAGEIHQKRPLIYQDSADGRVAIDGGYILHDRKTVGFSIGPHDATKPLIIDPTLVYSTFFGGAGTADQGNAIAVDSAGNAYVTGQTTSTDLFTSGGIRSSAAGQMDGFIMKLDPTGTVVVYSTYFGGSATDEGHSIAIDAAQNVYVTGFTSSSDFPVVNAIQTTRGGLQDAYVLKLSSTGNALLFSTYLGGSADDRGFGVAVDAFGNAYVAGATSSPNFPVANPFQRTNAGGLNDVFVTKLGPAGNLIYSTFVGGVGVDQAYSIAVDGSGNAYVVGYTTSTNFPLVNAYQSTYGGGSDDGFAFELNAAGNALVYSTYLGGTGSDNAVRVIVDSGGSAYITGYTASTNFPTANAHQATLGGGLDAFVTRLSADGKSLVFSTYLGAEDTDSGTGIALDSAGNIYVAGYTTSFTFPVVNAVQDRIGGDRDAYVVKFDPDANIIVYATFLGGTGADAAVGLAVDRAGNAYLTGLVGSSDFPTANPIQSSLSVAQDAFIAKINASDIVSSVPFPIASQGGATFATKGTRGDLVFGYATAESVRSDIPLNGVGILQFSQSGSTSTEVGVLAPPLVQVGRFAVEVTSVVKSVLSIVNPSDDTATVNFFFTNEAGETSNFATTTIAPHQHFSRFVNDDPILIPTDSVGTLNFTSDVPVAASAFRTFTNESSQFLISPTPIANPLTVSNEPVVIPEFAEGGGWNSRIVLVNTTEDEMTGTIGFIGQGGSPLDVTIDDGSITSAVAYDIPPRTERRITTLGSAGIIQAPFSGKAGSFYKTPGAGLGQTTGVAVVEGGSPSTPLNGLQLLQYRASNVTTSEAAMLAAPLRTAGRLFVEATSQIRSLIVIANPSDQDVTVEFSVADSTGTVTTSASVVVPAGGQFSGFVGDDPLGVTVSSTGALTFSSAIPVSVSAWRYLTNSNSELVISAIPIADVPTAVNQPLIIPHFVDGAGWNSQIVLVNTTDVEMSGELRFFSQSTGSEPGVPTDVAIVGGGAASVLQYDVPARSFQRFETAGTGELIQAGSIYVVPFSGTTPYAYTTVNFHNTGIVVSENAIPGQLPAASLRFYAEASGDLTDAGTNSVDTGIAIANPSSTTATVRLDLTDLNGTAVGTSSTQILPNGQITLLLTQTPGFENVKRPFRGILRLTTLSGSGVSAVALRVLYNEKKNVLTATTGPLDETVNSARIIFPYLTDGAGYSSQFILVNSGTAASFAGLLRFIAPDSTPLEVAEVRLGSVYVVPSQGSNTPHAHAILSYREGINTILQTDVEGQKPAGNYRLYVETLDSFGVPGSTNTSIALANALGAPATVRLDLTDLTGVPVASTSIQIPANGEVAAFFNQFPGFERITAPFQGLLRVTASSGSGITAVGLRTMFNESSNLLFTTIGPFYENAGSPGQLIFPHIAEGGGYITRFVVVAGATGQGTSGTLRFFNSSGVPLNVPLTAQ